MTKPTTTTTTTTATNTTSTTASSSYTNDGEIFEELAHEFATLNNSFTETLSMYMDDDDDDDDDNDDDDMVNNEYVDASMDRKANNVNNRENNKSGINTHNSNRNRSTSDVTTATNTATDDDDSQLHYQDYDTQFIRQYQLHKLSSSMSSSHHLLKNSSSSNDVLLATKQQQQQQHDDRSPTTTFSTASILNHSFNVPPVMDISANIHIMNYNDSQSNNTNSPRVMNSSPSPSLSVMNQIIIDQQQQQQQQHTTTSASTHRKHQTNNNNNSSSSSSLMLDNVKYVDHTSDDGGGSDSDSDCTTDTCSVGEVETLVLNTDDAGDVHQTTTTTNTSVISSSSSNNNSSNRRLTTNNINLATSSDAVSSASASSLLSSSISSPKSHHIQLNQHSYLQIAEQAPVIQMGDLVLRRYNNFFNKKFYRQSSLASSSTTITTTTTTSPSPLLSPSLSSQKPQQQQHGTTTTPHSSVSRNSISGTTTSSSSSYSSGGSGGGSSGNLFQKASSSGSPILRHMRSRSSENFALRSNHGSGTHSHQPSYENMILQFNSNNSSSSSGNTSGNQGGVQGSPSSKTSTSLPSSPSPLLSSVASSPTQSPLTSPRSNNNNNGTPTATPTTSSLSHFGGGDFSHGRDALTYNLLETRDQLPNHVGITIDYLTQDLVLVDENMTTMRHTSHSKSYVSTSSHSSPRSRTHVQRRSKTINHASSQSNSTSLFLSQVSSGGTSSSSSMMKSEIEFDFDSQSDTSESNSVTPNDECLSPMSDSQSIMAGPSLSSLVSSSGSGSIMQVMPAQASSMAVPPLSLGGNASGGANSASFTQQQQQQQYQQAQPSQKPVKEKKGRFEKLSKIRKGVSMENMTGRNISLTSLAHLTSSSANKLGSFSITQDHHNNNDEPSSASSGSGKRKRGLWLPSQSDSSNKNTQQQPSSSSNFLSAQSSATTLSTTKLTKSVSLNSIAERWREEDEDDTIEKLVSTDIKSAKRKLTTYIENVDTDPYCALATFEETFPVSDMKKEMHLDMEPQDMFLNNFVYSRDEYEDLYLLFEPRKFELDAVRAVSQDTEKLYCSATLFELNGSSFVRLTETFNFELMTEKLKRALFKVKRGADLSTVYLFCMYYRPFKGEYNESMNDIYMKGEKARAKDVLSFCSSSKQKYFSALQSIKSPFGYSACCLEPVTSTTEIDIPIFLVNPRHQGEASPESLLIGHVHETPNKKLKSIPGRFIISVSELTRFGLNAQREIDPLTFETIVEKNNGQRVRASEKGRLKCFKNDLIGLHNFLYIHPLSFKGTNNSDHKCIQIGAAFHQSDAHSLPMPSFINPFSAHPDSLDTMGYTSCTYKNRSPDFSSEIKCLLPSQMTTRHHFIFYVYNIASKEKQLSKHANGREFIGYCTLPVMVSDNALINDGEYVLDFYPDTKPPIANYLSEKPKVVIEKAFKLRVSSAALAYPDTSLSQILSVVNRDMSAFTNFASLANQISNLSYHLLPISPVIIIQMLNYLSRQTIKAKMFEILEVIMLIIDRTRRERPTILQNFIKYHLRSGQFCHSLVNAIRLYIIDDTVNVDLWLPNFGTLFSILLKSMAVKVAEEKQNAFSLDFYSSIGYLAENVVLFLQKAMERKETVKTKIVNSIFSSFLRQVLSFMDKQFVVTTAARYLELIGEIDTIAQKNDSFRSQQTIVEMRLLFFEEFFAGDSYMSLFFAEQETVDTIVLDKSNAFLVFSLYIDLVLKYLVDPAHSIRRRAVTFLRSFFVKMCLNDRKDSRTTGILLFEFISKFLDKMSEWKSIGDADRKKTYDSITSAKKNLTHIANKLVAKKEQLGTLQDIYRGDGATNQLFKKISREIKSLEIAKSQLASQIANSEHELQKFQQRYLEERRQLLICVSHALECCLYNHEKAFGQFCTLQADNSNKLCLLLMSLQLMLQAFEYEGTSALSKKFESMHSKLLHIPLIPPLTLSLPTRTRKNSTGSAPNSGRASKDSSSSNGGSTTPRRRGTLQQHISKIFGGDSNAAPAANSQPTTQPTISAPKAPKRKPSMMPSQFNNVVASQPLKERAEYVSDNIYNMQYLSERISMIVLRVLVLIIEKNHETLKVHADEGNMTALMDNIVRTLLNFLFLNQSKYVLQAILSYMRNFLSEFKNLVLCEEYCSYAIPLCEALMRICNSKFASVRKYTTALLYLFVKFYYTSNQNNMDGCRVATFLALSRTLQYTTPVANYLDEAIEHIYKYATSDTDAPEVEKSTSLRSKIQTVQTEENNNQSEQVNEFSQEIQKLTDDLRTLLKDTISITTASAKKDTTHNREDMYYRIATLYKNIPELSIEWFQQLIAYHKNVNQHAEAAQCYLQIISIVFDILSQNNSPILRGVPIRDFFNVSPNISLSGTSLRRQPPKIPSSWEFTEEGIISILKSTLDMFESAEHNESALHVFALLVPLLQRNDMWGELVLLSSGQMTHIYQRIEQYAQEKNQLFPRYYRFNFIGDNWPENMRDKQFIYKMPNILKLGNIKQFILDTFGDNVKLIKDVGRVDKSSLDPSHRFVQVTNVKPYIPDDSHDPSDFDGLEQEAPSPSKRRVSFGGLSHVIGAKRLYFDRDSERSFVRSRSEFDRNHNFNTFYYRTSFTKGSTKLSDDITEVYTRKVILVLAHAFPFVKTRQQVITTEEITLTPIEAAIENIIEQNRKLEEALYTSPPDVLHLQTVLKGGLAPEVNGGVEDVVRAFLSEDRRSNYELRYLQKLSQKCYIFVQLCKLAVRVHSEYAGQNYRQYDHLFSQKLQTLNHVVQSNLYLPNNHQTKNTRQLVELQNFLKKNLAYASIIENMDETGTDLNSCISPSARGIRSSARHSYRFSIPQEQINKRLHF